MGGHSAYVDRSHVSVSTGEVTGALGDSVTVLPLLAALGALTPVSIPHVLLWFGVFQIVWGVLYGLPLSVEPMKALAGLAIAGTIGYGELVAGGLLAGVVLLAAGRTNALARIQRYVDGSVVRGIQLAVALLLAEAGLGLALSAPVTTAWAVALVAVVTAAGYRRTSALVVLAAGAGIALATTGVPTLTLPGVAVFPGGAPEFTAGALTGAAGQLAMTVGNAAVATSLLCADLFDADVSADDLATSMGAMTLVAVPLGGLPMCHGSGGLAGKYAFGARTGGANVLLGVLYLLVALVAGVVLAFPTAVLGVLLALVALELGRNAVRTEVPALTVGVGLVGLFVDVGLAFVLGVVAHRLLAWRAEA